MPPQVALARVKNLQARAAPVVLPAISARYTVDEARAGQWRGRVTKTEAAPRLTHFCPLVGHRQREHAADVSALLRPRARERAGLGLCLACVASTAARYSTRLSLS